MPLLGSSSDSQLYIRCFLLIIYTNSSCWYHCRWRPVSMTIMLVKYYTYLSLHLGKCYVFIILNLSSCLFLYFHFCCSNVTGLLVNSNQSSQDSLVPPTVFPFVSFKVLLHLSHYTSVLSAKCLNSFSCINPRLRFFSINRGSTQKSRSFPTYLICLTYSGF